MEYRRRRWLVRSIVGTATLGTLIFGGALPASAHQHYAEPAHGGDGQVLANGQNHPRPFVAIGGGQYISCESTSATTDYGPAWYGLETAHHGPDSGEAGKSDRCYVADGNPALGQDDQNPAIT